MNSNLRFPDAVQLLMAEREMTYRKLGTEVGLSGGYLHHIVNGKRPVPDTATLEAIARALGVQPEHFLEFRARVVSRWLLDHPGRVNTLYKHATA